MNRLLLWAGPIVASLRGGIFHDPPYACLGCGRSVRVTRRSLIGTEGCTNCTPREREWVRSDQF